MFRTLTLAIIEAMLRILAAFAAGAGRALPRRAAQQRHLVAPAGAFGPVRVVFEVPRPPRMRRRKPPDRPIVKGGWTDV